MITVLNEATEKPILLKVIRVPQIKKATFCSILNEMSPLLLYFYFDSFIKLMIRLRLTENIAIAPCICMPIRPEEDATSYPCLCLSSLFFASIL
jgi:hypothetical protein